MPSILERSRVLRPLRCGHGRVETCLNILHANRQLRSEAASIFYQEYVGNPGGLSVQPIEGSDYRWKITGNSKEARLERLPLFSQSLAEHGATVCSSRSHPEIGHCKATTTGSRFEVGHAPLSYHIDLKV